MATSRLKRNLTPLDVAPATAREKIRPIEELAGIAERARARGKRVVLAHGVFDLLHMGHVRVYTISDAIDRYVNKGPGRPVFPEPMRAEMVAAMAMVGYVGVSNWPTAEGVLAMLRPDVYVKGREYEAEGDDITGGIRRERETVEKHGGRVHYTDDIVLSSSALINRHLNVFDSEVSAYLAGLRERTTPEALLGAVESIADSRVLLVGEAIIDEYQYTQPLGKAAKENIIATRYDSREVFAGGVIAAANHVADFVAEVEVVTLVGEQDSYEDLILSTVRDNVSVRFIRRADMPTTRKCRFVDPGHMRKLFEVYHFDDRPLSGATEAELVETLHACAGKFDVTIANDFGHGMLTRRAIDTLTRRSRFLAVNAQSNAGNLGFNPVTRYRKADYVCIDAPEARLAVRDKYSDLGELVQGHLREEIDCDRIVVTHGQNGCLTFGLDTGLARVPAFTRQVVDTVGAGDAFLAVTAPLVAAGTPMEQVGVIGNAVGALKVGIVGHRRSVEKVPLLKFLTTLMK